MRVHVADHPLITHKLTVLRDENTPSPMFRALAEELVTLLAYEATRDVRIEPVDDRDARSRPTTGVRDRRPAAARRADPARRARHARGHGQAAADRRGRVPRHGAQRGDPRADHLRRAPARRPHRPPVLRARPDARHRRLAHRRDRVPVRTRGARMSRRSASSPPPRASRPSRRRCTAARSRSCSARSTSTSTSTATSCPGSATPATASTARSRLCDVRAASRRIFASRHAGAGWTAEDFSESLFFADSCEPDTPSPDPPGCRTAPRTPCAVTARHPHVMN